MAEEKRREREKQVVGFLFLLGEQQAIKQASTQQIERSSREIHSSSCSSSSSEVCGVFFLFFLLFLFARELPCKNEFLVTKPNPVFFS